MTTIPYVYTDLLSPGSLHNSMESIFQDSQASVTGKKSVIPVRTWSRGSPFKPGKVGNKNPPVADSIGTFDDGGLADYLANMTMIENDENVDHPGISKDGKDMNHSGLDMTEDQIRGFMMPPDEEMDGPGGQYSEVFHGEDSDQDEYASYANDHGTFLEDQDSVLYGMGRGEVGEEEDDMEDEGEGGEEVEDEEEYGEEDEEDDEEEEVEDGEEEEEDDDDEEEDDQKKSNKLHQFDFDDMLADPTKFMTSYHSLYKNGHLIDPKNTSPKHFQIGDEQNDGEGHDEESLQSIMNDYTELLSYMDSPRANNKKALKDNLNFIMDNGNIINLDQGGEKKGKKNNKAKPGALEFGNIDSAANIFDQDGQPALPSKKKKSGDKKKKKKSNFEVEIQYGPNGRLIQKKKPKKSAQQAANNAAVMRHRVCLK